MKMIKRALSFDDVLLVPEYSKILSRNNVDTRTTICNLKLDIPIVSANMTSVTGKVMALEISRLGGLGILPRLIPKSEIEEAIRFVKGGKNKHIVGFSFGVGEDWYDELRHGVKCGGDIGCLDVAHAHHIKVKNVLETLMKSDEFDAFPLIIGNISTRESCIFLYYTIYNILENILGAAAATQYIQKYIAFKVGIGGGSLCTTRIMTGCGMPTLQSIMYASEINNTSGRKVTIIGDGGIKSSGDIVKSLAAGAHAVMLGNLLAGTKESPGNVIKVNNGSLYKIYRGSASFADKRDRSENVAYIEGSEALVPYKGSVENVIASLCDGIRSGMSYTGSENISDLHNSEMCEITQAGLRESHPHGLLS